MLIALPSTFASLYTHAQKLLLANEKVLFSFRTADDRKVVLASDTSDRYIVYRRGTNKNVELQYPPFLDSSSWHLFTYSGVIRPQNFDGSGVLDLNFLTFYHDHRRFIVYQTTYEGIDRSVGLKVQNVLGNRKTNTRGIYKTVQGDLSVFRGDDRIRQDDKMYED